MKKPRYRILIIPNTIDSESYFANKWFSRKIKNITDNMHMEPFGDNNFIIWTETKAS